MVTYIRVQSRRGFTKGNYITKIEEAKMTLVYEKQSVAKAAYITQKKATEGQEQNFSYDGNCVITQIFPQTPESELVEQAISELEGIKKYDGVLQKVNYVVIKDGDI